MKYLNILRLLIFLIPLLGLSQYSKIENDDLKLFYPTVLNDSIKIQNLNLELINHMNQYYMIDQLGGYVFRLNGKNLERIDNSYQHKMQLGSELIVQNDTILDMEVMGFETRSLLTFMISILMNGMLSRLRIWVQKNLAFEFIE